MPTVGHMEITLAIVCEAKDECAEGPGRLPGPFELAAIAQDILSNETKDDYEVPFRVTEVRA